MLLDQIGRAILLAAAGRPISIGVFTDLQEFIAVFVDRCHHGRSDQQ